MLQRREQRGTAFFQPEVQQDGKRRRDQRENGKIAGPAEPPACEQIDTDENDGIDPGAEQRQQDAHALLDGRDFIRPRKIRLFDPQKQGKAGREEDEKKRNKEKQQALRQEYLEDVKANFRAQMENTSIKEPDGTIHRVVRRADLKSQD